MPVKFFRLDPNEIIGTIPQFTTLADIEVEEGTILFQNKKLERGTRLILTDNTLNNLYKKNCYDCILAKRIIKGKVISETEDVDGIPIYQYIIIK